MPGLYRGALRRLTILLSLTGLVTVASGHVGSPDTIFEGMAGPYPVRVTINAPSVIPARVDVLVRVTGAGVRRVSAGIRFWNTRPQDAPVPDELTRVPGDATVWATSLWVMLQGSFAVQVHVDGDSGSGSVIVPVSAVAQRIAPLDAKVGIPLVILFSVLIVGLITIVGAGASEALTEPGAEPTDAARRTSSRARLVAGAVLLIVFGVFGTWWRSVDRAHRAALFVPTKLALSLQGDAARPRLRISFRSTEPLGPGVRTPTPLIPDHGKLMHLFLVSQDMGALAHLHPTAIDSTTFEAALPALPTARYYVFGDVVHGSGFSETLVGSDSISSAPTQWERSDPDDAVYASTDASANALPNDVRLIWDDSASLRRVGADARLSFTLRDKAGQVLDVNPYLGMAGHAVVMRSDGSVYTHLHPAGTTSMSAQLVLAAGPPADRGRQERSAGKRANRKRAESQAQPADHAAMAGVDVRSSPDSVQSMPGQLSFPYAFPQPGTYAIWVQFRFMGSIRTAVFHTSVQPR